MSFLIQSDEMPEELKITVIISLLPQSYSLMFCFLKVSGLHRTTWKIKGKISYSRTGDSWIDNTGSYEIGFILNSENEITHLTFTVKTEFQRGEPVTNAVEPVIRI
jgi:hypothetical protein